MPLHGRVVVEAILAVRADAALLRLEPLGVADVLLARRHFWLFGRVKLIDAAEDRDVTVVLVDAGETVRLLADHGRHVLEDHGAPGLTTAVTARAVELSEVLEVVVLDDHRADA